MLRAAETTSWLFDWIALHLDFESRRGANSIFFFGGRISDTPFETDIVDGKIKVLSLFGDEGLPDAATSESGDGALVIEDMLRVVHTPAILFNPIGKDSKQRDIEHFTRMAFYELGLGEIEDSPYPVSEKCLQDRFVFKHGDLSVAVYCFETAQRLGRADCERIEEGIADQIAWGRRFDRVLVVFDDQFGCDPNRRDSANRDSLDRFATDNNFSLINAFDLARLVLGIIDHGWCHEAVLSDLLQPGRSICLPPHSNVIGETYRYWEKSKVIGVQLNKDVVVRRGEKLAISAKISFHEIELGEFRIDDGNRLTVVCDMPRELFHPGGAVFKLDRETSYSNKYRYDEQAAGPFTNPKYREDTEPTGVSDGAG